jgi:hypothetical protein
MDEAEPRPLAGKADAYDAALTALREDATGERRLLPPGAGNWRRHLARAHEGLGRNEGSSHPLWRVCSLTCLVGFYADFLALRHTTPFAGQ